MVSTREEFLKLFNNLSDLFNVYKCEEDVIRSYEDIFLLVSTYWNVNIVDIEIDEFDKIVEIIDKIRRGYISNLKYFSHIKKYLKNILSKFNYEHNDKRNWRYKCPEMYSTIYDLEEEMMNTLEQLLELMEMSPFELFEIMTFCERISLRNICNEKRVPYDIERYISGIIGF